MNDEPAGATSTETANLTAGSLALPSVAERARMQAFVNDRADPSAVRTTLKDMTGRLVDCVIRERQPAMRRPDMAGQRVHTPPKNFPHAPRPPLPPGTEAVKFSRLYDPATNVAAGRPPASAERTCPPGTVAIPRVTMADVSRFSTLEDFFEREPPAHPGSTLNHQYASVYQWLQNWGGFSGMNVWNPFVQASSEFSLTQMWVEANSETVEVGFQKYPGHYGDSSTHFFIYSFRESGYQCYNNECNDFVNYDSSGVYPGIAIDPTSVDGGTQIVGWPSWIKDTDNGDWWLAYGYYWATLQWVGYYPRSLYSANGLINHSNLLQFGGEIIDNRTTGTHTQTDMGSGQFPSAGFNHAAFQYVLQYAADANWSIWPDATGMSPYVTDSFCYDVSYTAGPDPYYGSYFLYGGPGYDSVNCY